MHLSSLLNIPQVKKSFSKIRKVGAFAAFMLIFVVANIVVSCNNDSTIGGETVSSEIEIIVDSSFTVTGHSVATEAVLSRTVMQMMGVIDAPGFGYMRSDVVTQFMPSNTLDTAGVTVNDVDSLKLIMLVNKSSFVGDSLALLGMEVYPLTKQLTAPIYSNFNPEGYYDAGKLLGSTVYSMTKSSEPDSLIGVNAFVINIDLPLEMAHNFYNEFVTNPASYSSPSAFAKFFPGLYIKNSYGSGRMTRIGSTTMQMYFHQHTKTDAGKDTTIYKSGTYFAVTPEIVTNNDITLNLSDEITTKVDAGEVLMVAPAGLDVEVRFPAREIISAYNNGTHGALGVVNTLTLEIPVENLPNKYDITAPGDVVLLLAKDRDNFFIKNQLPDNVTSFRSTLTALSNGKSGYAFTDMRQYIVDLMNKETVSEEDFTFVLVPVNVTTETNNDYYGSATTTVTAVVPYVTEPKMARILLDQAGIKFVYTLQKTNY